MVSQAKNHFSEHFSVLSGNDGFENPTQMGGRFDPKSEMSPDFAD